MLIDLQLIKLSKIKTCLSALLLGSMNENDFHVHLLFCNRVGGPLPLPLLYDRFLLLFQCIGAVIFVVISHFNVRLLNSAGTTHFVEVVIVFCD